MSNEKNAIFITARSSSSRLPKKHLLKIQEKTCLEYLIQRVKKSKRADCIVLCTTTNKEDDLLCEIAEKNEILFFRGNEEDKVLRWKGACDTFSVDFFATADGDDLFCEPLLIDLCFEQHKETQADFIRWENCGIGVGFFTYGISYGSLKKICESKKETKTEYMWLLFESCEEIKIEDLRKIPQVFKRPDIRATLDYAEDFWFFAHIIDHFCRKGKEYCSLVDIIKYLDKNPYVIQFNQFRDKDWRENQNKTIV